MRIDMALSLLLLLNFASQLHGQSEATATIRAQANLVIVDVAVTDARHHPVQHLRANDFTLLEDGIPQQVKLFEEHSAPRPEEIARRPPMPKLPPDYYTNYTPAPADGTVNVLLLDAMNTPMKDQAYVREQLLDYLKQASPGAPIAIFGLASKLVLLQGFSADPEILKQAVLTRGGGQTSGLLDDPLNGATSENITDFMRAPMGGVGPSSKMQGDIQDAEAQHSSLQLQQRALYTLTAMNQLALYLASIPGRKNLIWFSGSFPINLLPNSDLNDPFAYVANAEEEYRETTNLLTRGQVAVYPIDARGHITSAVHAASNPAKQYSKNPHSFAKDQANFYRELFAENETMQDMARDTGGRAFVDTDGLTAALAEAVDSGANYYTFTYTPTATNWNGKYRKIQVKLEAARGVTLAYRRGYYADDPQSPKAVRASAAAPNRPSAMTVAMMRGAPGPTEILLKMRILPAGTAPEAAVAEGNAVNRDRKVEGPFRRFLLDSETDLGGLFWTVTPDGNRLCEVEFVTFVYDANGFMVDAVDTPVKIDFTPARFAALARTGLPFHQEVSVPLKGEYFLRTAVHDLRADRVGAIEVPVAAIGSKQPRIAYP